MNKIEYNNYRKKTNKKNNAMKLTKTECNQKEMDKIRKELEKIKIKNII